MSDLKTGTDGLPPIVPTRRGLFAGGLVGLTGAALAGCERGGKAPSSPAAASSTGKGAHPSIVGKATWDVTSGPARQSGVMTPPGTHGHWLGIDLPASATRDTLRRLLVVLDDTASRFVKGGVPLTDVAEELAAPEGNIAICIGFARRMFDLPGMNAAPPTWLEPIPAMTVDKFEDPWQQTDLVVQIDAHNPVVVSHVTSQIVASINGVASVTWQQRGFRAAARPSDGGVTRNLFGQLDGQEQPDVSGNEANRLWNSPHPGASWMESSTGMVIRRIRMDVETWQSLDRDAQENAVGRRLSNGAPLTGAQPTDPVDMSKRDNLGMTVINAAAHVPRAMPDKPGERILRRPFNYEEVRSDGSGDRGLIFVAFCADIQQQFVPIQRRLAEADLLNTWTTPIGSAVYLIPAAPRPGKYLGQEIVEA